MNPFYEGVFAAILGVSFYGNPYKKANAHIDLSQGHADACNRKLAGLLNQSHAAVDFNDLKAAYGEENAQELFDAYKKLPRQI